MKSFKVRYTLIGVLLLAMAIPGLAMAEHGKKDCTLQGTWFGVVSPENKVLSGWMVTAEGKSNGHGTNNLEYPNFDATLGNNFPDAVRISTLRGAWVRTGGNSFDYTMTGMAVAANGVTPVWIGKLSGHITLSEDCNSEEITATFEIFEPSVSPFDGDPLFPIFLPTHNGYRAYVDLP